MSPVRLKTVGGSVGWLQPYLMAAQIKANDTGIADGIAKGLGSIGQSIDAGRERKERAAVRVEDKRRFDEQMALRVKSEQTEQDRFSAQFLQASILQKQQRLMALDEEDPTQAQEAAKIRQEGTSEASSLSVVKQRLGMAEADTLRADIDRTISRPIGPVPMGEVASMEARYASPVPATGALPSQPTPGTATEPDSEEGWYSAVAEGKAQIENLEKAAERFDKAGNRAAANKRRDSILLITRKIAPYELRLSLAKEKRQAGASTAAGIAATDASDAAEVEAYNKANPDAKITSVRQIGPMTSGGLRSDEAEKARVFRAEESRKTREAMASRMSARAAQRDKIHNEMMDFRKQGLAQQADLAAKRLAAIDAENDVDNAFHELSLISRDWQNSPYKQADLDAARAKYEAAVKKNAGASQDATTSARASAAKEIAAIEKEQGAEAAKAAAPAIFQKYGIR